MWPAVRGGAGSRPSPNDLALVLLGRSWALADGGRGCQAAELKRPLLVVAQPLNRVRRGLPDGAPFPPSLAPTKEQVPAGLIVRLTGFPERLIAKDGPMPSAEMVKGKVLWTQSYNTEGGFEAFQIILCDGVCELPLVKRLKAVDTSVALVETKTATLSNRRTVEADLAAAGLGGALAFSVAPSPAERFTVLTIFGLPLHDVPMSDATRAFFRDCAPLDLSLALGKGVDAALFPR